MKRNKERKSYVNEKQYRRNGKPYTEEENDLIRDLNSQGYHASDIAKRLFRTEKSISMFFSVNKIPRMYRKLKEEKRGVKGNRFFVEENDKEIEKEYKT